MNLNFSFRKYWYSTKIHHGPGILVSGNFFMFTATMVFFAIFVGLRVREKTNSFSDFVIATGHETAPFVLLGVGLTVIIDANEKRRGDVA